LENLDLGLNLGFVSEDNLDKLLDTLTLLEEGINTLNATEDTSNVFYIMLKNAIRLKKELEDIKEIYKDIDNGKNKSNGKDSGKEKGDLKSTIIDLTQQIKNLVDVYKSTQSEKRKPTSNTGSTGRDGSGRRQYYENDTELDRINNELRTNAKAYNKDYSNKRNLNTTDYFRKLTDENVRVLKDTMKMFEGLTKESINKLSDNNFNSILSNGISKKLQEISKKTEGEDNFNKLAKELFNNISKQVGNNDFINFPKVKSSMNKGKTQSIKNEIFEIEGKFESIGLKKSDLTLVNSINDLRKVLEGVKNQAELFERDRHKDYKPSKELEKMYGKFNRDKYRGNKEYFDKKTEYELTYDAYNEQKKQNSLNKEEYLDRIRTGASTIFFTREVLNYLGNIGGFNGAKDFERNVTSLGVSGNIEYRGAVDNQKTKLLSKTGSTGIDTNEYAMNLREVIKTGRDYEQSIKIVDTASQLATTSFEDLTTAVNILNGKFLALDMDMSDDRIDRVKNRIYNILDNTALDLQDIANAGKQTNPILNSMVDSAENRGSLKNQSIEDYKEQLISIEQSFVGELRQQGKTGEQAGTVIRNLFTKLMEVDGVAGKMLDKDLMKVDKQTLDKAGFSSAKELSELWQTGDVEKALNGLSMLVAKGEISFTTLKKMVTERHSSSVVSVFSKINGDLSTFIDNMSKGKNLADKQKQALDNWASSLDRIKNNLANIGKNMYTTGVIGTGIGVVGKGLDLATQGISGMMNSNNIPLSSLATGTTQAITLGMTYNTIKGHIQDKAIKNVNSSFDRIQNNLLMQKEKYKGNEKLEYFYDSRLSKLGQNKEKLIQDIQSKGNLKDFVTTTRVASSSVSDLTNNLNNLGLTGASSLEGLKKGMSGVLSSISGFLMNNAWLIVIAGVLTAVTKIYQRMEQIKQMTAEAGKTVDSMKELENQSKILENNIENILKIDNKDSTVDDYKTVIDGYISKNEDLMESFRKLKQFRESAFESLDDIITKKIDELNKNLNKEGNIDSSKNYNLFEVSGKGAFLKENLDKVSTWKQTVNSVGRDYNDVYTRVLKTNSNKIINDLSKETSNFKNISKEDKNKFIARELFNRYDVEYLNNMFGTNFEKGKEYNPYERLKTIMSVEKDSNGDGSNFDEIVTKFTAGNHITPEQKQEIVNYLKQLQEKINEGQELYLKQLDIYKESLQNTKDRLQKYNNDIKAIGLQTKMPQVITQDLLKEEYRKDSKGRQIYKDSDGNILNNDAFSEEQLDKLLVSGKYNPVMNTLSKGKLDKLNSEYKSKINSISPMMWENNSEGVQKYSADLAEIYTKRADLMKKLEDDEEQRRLFEKEGKKSEMEMADRRIQALKEDLENNSKLEESAKHYLELSNYNFTTIQNVAQLYSELGVKQAQFGNMVGKAFGNAGSSMMESYQGLNARRKYFNQFGNMQMQNQIISANANKEYREIAKSQGLSDFSQSNLGTLSRMRNKMLEATKNGQDKVDGIDISKFNEAYGIMTSIASEQVRYKQQELEFAMQEKQLKIDVVKYWLNENKLKTQFLESGDVLRNEFEQRTLGTVRKATSGDSDLYRMNDLQEMTNLKLENSNLKMKDQLDYARRQIAVAKENAQRQINAIRKLEGTSSNNSRKSDSVAKTNTNATNKTIVDSANAISTNLVNAMNSMMETMNSMSMGGEDLYIEGGSTVKEYKQGIQQGYNPNADNWTKYWQVYNIANKLGDPHPMLTASQWAEESGWGKAPSGKNNLFGVKGTYKGQGSIKNASEGGKARFRDYNNVYESIKDHIDLKMNGSAFRNLGYKTSKTDEEALNRIAGMYVDGKISGGSQTATYLKNVNSIMQKAKRNFGKPSNANIQEAKPNLIKTNPQQITGGYVKDTKKVINGARGLRMKDPKENTGGGKITQSTYDFAKIVQDNIKGFNQFTAFNDEYHTKLKYHSKHLDGIKFDFVINGGLNSSYGTVNQLKALAKKYGYDISVINEYAKPSKNASGGHIDVQVNGRRGGKGTFNGSQNLSIDLEMPEQYTPTFEKGIENELKKITDNENFKEMIRSQQDEEGATFMAQVFKEEFDKSDNYVESLVRFKERMNKFIDENSDKDMTVTKDLIKNVEDNMKNRLETAHDSYDKMLSQFIENVKSINYSFEELRLKVEDVNTEWERNYNFLTRNKLADVLDEFTHNIQVNNAKIDSFNKQTLKDVYINQKTIDMLNYLEKFDNLDLSSQEKRYNFMTNNSDLLKQIKQREDNMFKLGESTFRSFGLDKLAFDNLSKEERTEVINKAITEIVKNNDKSQEMFTKIQNLDNELSMKRMLEEQVERNNETKKLESENYKLLNKSIEDLSSGIKELSNKIFNLENIRNLNTTMKEIELLNNGVDLDSAYGKKQMALYKAENSKKAMEDNAQLLKTLITSDPFTRSALEYAGFDSNSFYNADLKNIKNIKTLTQGISEFMELQNVNFKNAFNEMILNNPVLQKYSNINVYDSESLKNLKDTVLNDNSIDNSEKEVIVNLINQFENGYIKFDEVINAIQKLTTSFKDSNNKFIETFKHFSNKSVDMLSSILFGTDFEWKGLDYKESLNYLFSMLSDDYKGIRKGFNKFFGIQDKEDNTTLISQSFSKRPQNPSRNLDVVDLGKYDYRTILLNKTREFDLSKSEQDNVFVDSLGNIINAKYIEQGQEIIDMFKNGTLKKFTLDDGSESLLELDNKGNVNLLELQKNAENTKVYLIDSITKEVKYMEDIKGSYDEALTNLDKQLINNNSNSVNKVGKDKLNYLVNERGLSSLNTEQHTPIDINRFKVIDNFEKENQNYKLETQKYLSNSRDNIEKIRKFNNDNEKTNLELVNEIESMYEDLRKGGLNYKIDTNTGIIYKVGNQVQKSISTEKNKITKVKEGIDTIKYMLDDKLVGSLHIEKNKKGDSFKFYGKNANGEIINYNGFNKVSRKNLEKKWNELQEQYFENIKKNNPYSNDSKTITETELTEFYNARKHSKINNGKKITIEYNDTKDKANDFYSMQNRLGTSQQNSGNNGYDYSYSEQDYFNTLKLKDDRLRHNRNNFYNLNKDFRNSSTQSMNGGNLAQPKQILSIDTDDKGFIYSVNNEEIGKLYYTPSQKDKSKFDIVYQEKGKEISKILYDLTEKEVEQNITRISDEKVQDLKLRYETQNPTPKINSSGASNFSKVEEKSNKLFGENAIKNKIDINSINTKSFNASDMPSFKGKGLKGNEAFFNYIAEKTGIPVEWLIAEAYSESGINPLQVDKHYDNKNKKWVESSYKGLYQVGKDYWTPKKAKEVSEYFGVNIGDYSNNWKDPQQNTLMVVYRMLEEVNRMKKAGLKEISFGNVYSSHMLPAYANKMDILDNSIKVIDMDRAIKQKHMVGNKPLLYTSGLNTTNGEVKQNMINRGLSKLKESGFLTNEYFNNLSNKDNIISNANNVLMVYDNALQQGIITINDKYLSASAEVSDYGDPAVRQYAKDTVEIKENSSSDDKKVNTLSQGHEDTGAISNGYKETKKSLELIQTNLADKTFEDYKKQKQQEKEALRQEREQKFQKPFAYTTTLVTVIDGMMKRELNYKKKALEVQSKILEMNLQMAETTEERRRIEEQILQNKLATVDNDYKTQSTFLGGMFGGKTGFALQGALGGATQGASVGGVTGALIGTGLGFVGGLLGGTQAKIQAEQQKAQLVAQQKLTWLAEDRNKYLKTMASAMSEQAKWTTKIGVNDAISRSVRFALTGKDVIGGTAYETRTVGRKKKKGGGLLGSKKYDTVEAFTSSYNLNDSMFGGRQFNNRLDLEFAYTTLAQRLLGMQGNINPMGNYGEMYYYNNPEQEIFKKYLRGGRKQKTSMRLFSDNGLNDYLQRRFSDSSRELTASEFIKYFNGQGTLQGDGLLIDRSRDNEIDNIINNLKETAKAMPTGQQKVDTLALINFYENIKAVLDKEGKTTKRLFGNYYGIETEEVKDEKGNITEYRRVNESMWSEMYQQIYQNVMNGAKTFDVGSKFISGTVNAFIQNVGSGRNTVKAITEEFNRLADQIYDVVTRTGEFTNVNSTIQSLINNTSLLRQQQKETEKFTIDLAKRWVALGGNITDVIKDMNNGLTTSMESIKSTMLGASMEETINNFGNNLWQKLGESMTTNLINKKYANDIFKMNGLLTNATDSNSISDIVSLANGYKGLSTRIESDRERLSAIQRLFTANRDIDYVDENIQYETGTSQSVTNNYTFTTDINAGTIVADELSKEILAQNLFAPLVQMLRDNGFIN
jgi:lambda family phage tail tape measure protein